jgi:hypothetical protein
MQFSLFYLILICIYLKSIFSEQKNKCKITLKTISSIFDCILSKLFRVWINISDPYSLEENTVLLILVFLTTFTRNQFLVNHYNFFLMI